MSEPRLLEPHEIQAQRAWAEEEGRPEIIAIFQHVSILERQLAEAGESIRRCGQSEGRYKALAERWQDELETARVALQALSPRRFD